MPDATDQQARELIEQFGDALRALRDGKAVPAHWRQWTEAALGPKLKRGTSPNPYVQQRNAGWADAMLQAEIERERGREKRGPTEVATELARQATADRRDGALSAADVFKANATGGNQAIARRVVAKLDKADDELTAERRRQTAERRAGRSSANPPKTRK